MDTLASTEASHTDFIGWDEPQRRANPTQPFIGEFPSLLYWINENEVVLGVVEWQRGKVAYLRGSVLDVGGFTRVHKVRRMTDGTLC